jgi:HEAT repeat protein
VDTTETRRESAQEQEPSPDWSLQDLVKALATPYRREIRRDAAERLGQLGEAAAPAIPALLIAAVDASADVRKAALNALKAVDPDWTENAAISEALPSLVAALRGRSQQVDQAASALLREIGQPAVPALCSALLDGEDNLKQIRLMRLLAWIDPGAVCAIPPLTRALSSKFLHVRIEAARRLADTGPPPEAALPALMAGLSERSLEARQAMAACLALAGAAAEPAIPFLLPLLADRDGGVRKAAAAALAGIGPPVVPALIELIQTRDAQRLKTWTESCDRFQPWRHPAERDILVIESWESWKNLWWAAYDILDEHTRLETAQEAALGILAELGYASSAAVPAVTRALADPNPAIQLAAIHTLRQIGPRARSATPDLLQMIAHRDESFRAAAVSALNSIYSSWTLYPGALGVLAGLAKQLSDAGEPGESIVRTFAMIGGPAVPALIDTLTSGNRVAQENAAKALGHIGAGAQEAIPALTGVLQDSHPGVQEAAAEALSEIEEQVAQTPAPPDAAGVSGPENGAE